MLLQISEDSVHCTESFSRKIRELFDMFLLKKFPNFNLNFRELFDIFLLEKFPKRRN